MSQESDYVKYFYDKFNGRVAIGVGYNKDLSEIYPFVFEDSAGNSIGVVALGVYTYEGINYVHIYHIGSFKSSRGDGSQIIQTLCHQTDKFQIILSLSPIFMPNEKDELISDERLREWCGRYGFTGRSHFRREPSKIKKIIDFV